MGASRQDMHLQKRRAAKVFLQRPFRQGIAAFRVNGHLFPILFGAGNGLFDPAGGVFHFPVHHGQIALVHGALPQLFAQAFVSLIVFGDHQKAAGILIQPVDDAGPLDPADAAQIVHGVQQGVHQRAGLVARRRMHHHAPRLVDHRYILVLVKDLQRNIFFFYGQLHRVGDGQLHRIAGIHRKAGLGADAPVHPAQALFDPLCRLRAAAFAHFRDDHVQTGLIFRLQPNGLHPVPSNPADGTAY